MENYFIIIYLGVIILIIVNNIHTLNVNTLRGANQKILSESTSITTVDGTNKDDRRNLRVENGNINNNNNHKFTMINKRTDKFHDIQDYRNTGNLISNFTQHNIKYMDEFVIKIRKPLPNAIVYKYVYEGNMWFEKNSMKVVKYFYSNDITDLLDDASKFISREVKI
jgi:hypothetical protein